MANGQSSLENIFDYSFPGYNLLQISIVKQIGDLPGYKKQHFCFINLAPGEKTQQGGRTFNFQNRINLKADADRVLSLAHAVRAYARGADQTIGQFSIFVDSSKSQYGGQGGTFKSISLKRDQDQKTQAPVVLLFFKQGNNPAKPYGMNIPTALAFADICEIIGKKVIELEMGRDQVSVQPNPQQRAPQQNYQQSPPPQQSGPVVNDVPGPGQTPGGVANNFENNMQGIVDDDIPF